MTYIIDTLGCKVNQYETQALETLLCRRGFAPAKAGESADVVIVNTCAVTAESGRKSRQAVRRLREENPGALSVVCGCWSQVERDGALELGADLVFGSGSKEQVADAVAAAIKDGGAESPEPDSPFGRRVFEELPAGAFAGHARAYLKIEDGCQNFCTYCVIPYARGRVRSLPPERAAALARELMEEGYRELVLTGIEIASYGMDLPEKPTLSDAVRAIAAAAPELRLRLGSLEPTVVTREFCEALRDTGRVCPHFHLSLQSGCDRTLSAMRRKYDTAGFMECVSLLREYFPDCALTADLITGFPGETEEDHEDTLEFIGGVGFAAMHVFPYSRRPGTPADAMPEQLSHAVKSKRAKQAHELAEAMGNAYRRSRVGAELEVLFETEEEPGLWTGHAGDYSVVQARGEALRGLVKTVQITGVSGEMLVGVIV